jgi:hypothetical protein
VLVAGNRTTVDLENVDGTTYFSHLALVPGEAGSDEGKGENTSVSSKLKASSIKSIEGKFELLPLSADWPEPLKKWLGSPGERVEVRKPFLRSYDQ